MSKAAELANLIGNINAGGGGVNRNVIINGAMNVAQRGTSHTGLGGSTGAVYTLDRFLTFDSATAGRATVTQDSSAPSGFANSLKVACTTADTSIAADEIFLLQQRIEGQNLQGFAKGTSDAKPFTVSFYVKGNASATYTVELEDSDNTRYNSQEFSVTTDWVRVSRTFVADTTGAFDDDNASSLRLNFWLHAGSTYTGGTHTDNVWHTTSNQRIGDSQTSFFDSTSRTFFITGVQLEVGQNPTSFEHVPFDRTLAKCQRYYYVAMDSANEGDSHGPVGCNYNSSTARIVWFHPQHMRASPSLTFSGTLAVYSNGQFDNTTTYNVLSSNNKYAQLNNSQISATGGDGCFSYATEANAAKIEFDSEL